jgi:trimethylamine---corrinoid protein Co-methyltransferase
LRLNVLTKEELQKLHQATLEVLETTGVEVYEDEALDLLKKAGAEVKGSRVRIPATLIDWALDAKQDLVTIYNRSGNPAMALDKFNVFFGLGSDTPYTIDLETRKRRLAVKADTINTTIVADVLPNIDFIMSLGLSSDVPNKTSDIHQFEAMLFYSDKPIMFTAHSKENMEIIVEMAAHVAGGNKVLEEKPFIFLYAEPSSPLRHTREAVEKLLLAAERKVPVAYTPAVMIGGTGPATLAGSLVMANSELLSGLVIHQLKSKGSPIIYGGGVPLLDMGTGNVTYGSPELHLGLAALATMARYYSLPVFGAAGCTDSLLFDQQAGIEAGYNILMSAMSGSNLIHDVGFVGSGTTSSLELLVSADETIGMVKRIISGINISSETLAVDVINEVGPGGQFMDCDHTFKHFRQEMWFPKLFNRDNHSNWAALGSLTLGDRAQVKAKEIIEANCCNKLDPGIQKEVSAILSRYEKEVS